MADDQGPDKGLVMVQIDGLSLTVLQQALSTGRMPFLGKLLEQEKYSLFPLYPGLPSTTPRVQGHLFYGVKMAVPSFSFRDHASGKLRRLYDPEAAAQIEDVLQESGEGLLKGGASYGNVYCGGAEECHFCTVSFGKDRLFREKNLLRLSVTLYRFFRSLLKSSILITVESVLAFADFFRGILSGHSLYKELKFIPSRIAISILLRDLIRDSVVMDIKQGLPVIHLNLVGYDEHSHRRGPGSPFALKTLKGIDAAIARIWKTADRKGKRKYILWIYSDHGQEEVARYEFEQGRSLRETVDTVLSEYEREKFSDEVHSERRGIQSLRSSLLGGRVFRKILGIKIVKNDVRRDKAVVTAIGPIGHFYLNEEPGPREKRRLGRALVDKAAIPLVLSTDGSGKVVAWNRDGEFILPDQAAEVFGAKHRYLEEVTADMIRLCHHEDAGTYVISGWRPNEKSLSFPVEGGAHGGPGYAENDAFVLLPEELSAGFLERDHLEIGDLRHTALSVLGRS